jgi:hypothetical protein
VDDNTNEEVQKVEGSGVEEETKGKRGRKSIQEGPKGITRPDKPLFSKFDVQWNFVTSLCSSVPADQNLIQSWLKARAPKVQPPGGRDIAGIQEEIVSTLAEPEEDLATKNLLIFQRMPLYTFPQLVASINATEEEKQTKILVMRTATIRAHIKDCARIISREYVGKVAGEMSWASRLINCVYHDPRHYWTPVLRQFDGRPFTKPDGIKEKAVHLWSGNALKAYEFVHDAQLNFQLMVLGDNVKLADFETLFQYGGVHGYAGERGDGEGRYAFTVKKVEAA